MKSIFSKLWNADFRKYNIPNLSLLWVIVAAGVAYLELHSALLIDFEMLFSKFIASDPTHSQFSFLLPAVIVVYAIYLAVIVLLHEKASYKKIGKKPLNSTTFPHFLVNIIDFIFVVIGIFILEKIFVFIFGVSWNLGSLSGVEGENHPFQAIIDFYNAHIPTYIELPYLLAIPVVLICADLPIYVAHYLTHKSRFLWFVVHRSHHSPEFMTPFGTGPVFAFALFIAIPYFFAALAESKLFYPEPLLVELMVIQLIYAFSEKFNHTSAFYDFSSKHRWFFKFFGNGPYHYMHHSAREGEEMVNIANMVFNFWDRVFGTFKEPDIEKPPIGLSHQPEIILNPFRLYLSGLATIIYELKHNAPKHWFSIVFGSVYYTPPITKEFLILSYPRPKLYSVK